MVIPLIHFLTSDSYKTGSGFEQAMLMSCDCLVGGTLKEFPNRE